MSLRRVLPASVFLLTMAIPLSAQSGSPLRSLGAADPIGGCPNIELDVRDSMGRAIMGATVVTENSVMQYTTNTQGAASIPCSSAALGIMTAMEVRAPGYEPSRVTIVPNTRSRLEVVLRDKDPLPIGTGLAVPVRELEKPVQQESRQLQSQAQHAVHHRDFEAAEKLYLQAIKLTPSNSSIPYNLGVLALYRNDMKAAGAWFEMATQIDPYNTEYVANLGMIRWMQDRRDESYGLLLKATAKGYESDPVNYIMGTLSLEKGLNEAAVSHLKKVSDGRFPYRDLLLSIAYRHLGNTKSADALYLNFLKRNPFPFAMNQTDAINPEVEAINLAANK